jgi:HTH-type transcriptional regulator/antitoxin MqsA
MHETPYTYKGRSTSFLLTGDKCPSCGEILLDSEGSIKFENDMENFQKEINLTLVDTSSITAIRKKLNLDQAEAERLFGLGPNAFSRYERGRVTPPNTLMILLRMLDERPEMLTDVRRWSKFSPGSEYSTC